MNETKLIATERRAGLLSTKISDLALRIPGTSLEPLIGELYQELENVGISFKPETYLSDEWGCPSTVPVIGIPFYLADPELCALEEEITGFEVEDNAEVLSYLRHEAGHAFNYAYRLYAMRSWRDTFGSFSRPYRDEYKPIPFSTKYVRYTPGWYAQKHPDDDFAETFGVWLDPNSAWREKYAGTAAMAKLRYVGRAARRYGRSPPMVSTGRLDIPVEEMAMTLDSWYQTCRETYGKRPSLPLSLDTDLARLFLAQRGQSAAEFLRANRGTLAREVNNWTGVDRHVVAGLVDEVTERVASLDLEVGGSRHPTDLARVSVFVTTLVMNYSRYGKFVPE